MNSAETHEKILTREKKMQFRLMDAKLFEETKLMMTNYEF